MVINIMTFIIFSIKSITRERELLSQHTQIRIMNKQTKPSSLPSYFEYHWTNHPWVEWVINNKQNVLWIILGLFAVLILSYRILMNRSMNAETDFFRAQTDFSQFQEAARNSKNKLADSAAFDDLEAVMKQHPELHGKYDAPLAQTLLIEEQMPKAQAYAQATFQRTDLDAIGHFHDYAAASLLIGEGKYQEALQQAQQLKEKMGTETLETMEETLYFFNLVRLALLNQQLGNGKAEKQLWEEIQNRSNQSPSMGSALSVFSAGHATMNQYIEQRKRL